MCMNISNTASIFKGVKKILDLLRFLESMDEGKSTLAPVMKDNQATINNLKK